MKTYKVTIDEWGTISWYNEKDQRHRENGPAIERPNGGKAWYRNGKLHREDGPACECSNGKKHWFLNDERYTETEFNEEMNKSKSNYTLIDDLKVLAEKHGFTLTPKK